MKRIVLLRHGESLWNQENRFTGWTDVDLSEKGVVEACKAGDTLQEVRVSLTHPDFQALCHCGCHALSLSEVL